MIVVFAMGFVVFNYSIQARLTKMFEQRDARENTYRHSCTVQLNVTPGHYAGNRDYRQYLQEGLLRIQAYPVNVTLIALNIVFDRAGISHLCDFYVGGDLPKYPLIWGRYPTREEIAGGGRYVVLGRHNMVYTYHEHGKRYIDLSGKRYQVTGCVSTGKSHYLDNTVLIFDTNCDAPLWENMNDYIIMGMAALAFETDEETDMAALAAELGAGIRDASDGAMEAVVVSASANLKPVSSYVPEPRYRKWAGLSYVFGVTATIFMLWYWLESRKRELAIKRTFGLSVPRIAVQLLSEACVVMLIGMLAGLAVILTCNGLAEGFVSMDREMLLYLAGIAAAYIGLTLFFIGIYQVVWLLRMEPVVLMSGRKGM